MTEPKQPTIFISYSHLDEADPLLRPTSERWLTYVVSHLKPAASHGKFELWDDRRIDGGGEWRAEIESALNRCAVCVFLVSRHSLSSRFILDVEIKQILERHHADGAHLYPIVITSVDLGAAPWLLNLQVRPTNGTALELYEQGPRNKVMSELAAEIRSIIERVVAGAASSEIDPIHASSMVPEIDRLPVTPYRKLVGRADELRALDQAWAANGANIISLIAWGGAGKTALVNEWLARLRGRDYDGAEAVLGWSFYDQGTKERATSADEFLNWALDKLGVQADISNARLKSERLADNLARQRVLLILDGIEPLQHGPGAQEGLLKDQGLRVLLRRYAAMPPAAAHGLIVITSRLAVRDIEQWKGTDNLGPAPVIDVSRLSDDAGAALLEDNGVKGSDRERRAAAHEFEGHALALSLLASFLSRRHQGDIRRRDRIGPLLQATDSRGHDHARRVMQAYESEWLKDEPTLIAILHLVGLFDRPASAGCVNALRREPAIAGLTDSLVELSPDNWADALSALREVRLLDPVDQMAPDSLDAHPLVREWFGERFKEKNESGWRAAHGRLYEYLRDTTKEGENPELERLGPLYQAIAHGSQARRHQEALDDIYKARICRRDPDGEFRYHSLYALGAVNSDLAAIGWFFKRPFDHPVSSLPSSDQSWVLGIAAFRLALLGRFAEALPLQQARLTLETVAEGWGNATLCAVNLGDIEIAMGRISAAIASTKTAVHYADKSKDEYYMMSTRCLLAEVFHAAGRVTDSQQLYAEALQRERKRTPRQPELASPEGYHYCDLLLARSEFATARNIANKTLAWSMQNRFLIAIGLDRLTLARSHLGMALERATPPVPPAARNYAHSARRWFEKAIDRLRIANASHEIARGHLAQAVLRRSVGDWVGVTRDLDEVLEIAEPGPMQLFLCDAALERARLAFARIEAFAPLHGLLEDSSPKPSVPDIEGIAKLTAEARTNLAESKKLIESCGYHRRDEELAELEAVLAGQKRFADLPPRV